MAEYDNEEARAASTLEVFHHPEIGSQLPVEDCQMAPIGRWSEIASLAAVAAPESLNIPLKIQMHERGAILGAVDDEEPLLIRREAQKLHLSQIL